MPPGVGRVLVDTEQAADRTAPASARRGPAGATETHGTYFNSKATPTPWPSAVLDETTRNTIWELCETHRDRQTPT